MDNGSDDTDDNRGVDGFGGDAYEATARHLA